jgi:hypothetical protein
MPENVINNNLNVGMEVGNFGISKQDLLKHQEHEPRTEFVYRDIKDVIKFLVRNSNLHLLSICNRLKNYIMDTKEGFR